jgi:hypothetical protein
VEATNHSRATGLWTARTERVNSFETDSDRQFGYECFGVQRGRQLLMLADGQPGLKGPLRRLRPLTPERPSA